MPPGARPRPRRAARRCPAAAALALALLAAAGPRRGSALENILTPEDMDAFFVLLMFDVGLAPGAKLYVNVTNAKPSDDVVLVLLSSWQWTWWLRTPLRPLRSDGGDYMGGYNGYRISSWRQPLYDRVCMTYTISGRKADRYFLGVLNMHGQPMRLEGVVEYENPQGQHLPLGLVYLPATLRIASVAFLGLTVAVASALSSSIRRGATALHMLLITCLWLKSAELTFKWKYFDLLQRVGDAPVWRCQVWQITAKLHGTAEVLLLLLTALGWRILRPRLSGTELRFTGFALGLASGAIALQAFTDGCPGLSESSMSFTLFFYIVRVACYLVIIFAMNFNLQLIAVHLQESPVSPATAGLYQRQQIYLRFRRLFLLIVFRPSALLWLRVVVFGTEGGAWLVAASSEGTSWLLYAALFAILKPTGPTCRLGELVRAMSDSPMTTPTGGAGLAGAPPAAAAEAAPAAGRAAGLRLAVGDGMGGTTSSAPPDGSPASAGASPELRRLGYESPVRRRGFGRAAEAAAASASSSGARLAAAAEPTWPPGGGGADVDDDDAEVASHYVRLAG